MKNMASDNNEPKLGGCYRLRVARQHSWTNHLVLVLAVAGEWCTILDLEAHGQPNPAAGERLRWTNSHFQFEPIPRSELPLAARLYHATAGAPANNANRPMPHRARQCELPAPRRSHLRFGLSVRLASAARSDADVVVTVA